MNRDNLGLTISMALVAIGLAGLVALHEPRCRTFFFESGTPLGEIVDTFHQYYPKVVIPQQVMPHRFDYNGFNWVTHGSQDITYCKRN